VAVLTAGTVAAVWVGGLLLARDSGLGTFGYDQAFFQQLVWNLDHGRWFVSSFSSGSFLGLHFEPLLVVAALAELVWPDPRSLSLLEAVSIAGLAPAAFLFLRSFTGRETIAGALAAPLPFWPALQEAARAGFHPETMGLCLALLAGWTGLEGRSRLCWPAALAALSAKEDQAWNVMLIGLAVATVPDRRRLGYQLAAVACAWGLLVIGVVMPLVRGGTGVDTTAYYGWLAHVSPGGVLHALANPGGWAAFLVMVACAGGLPLLRPAWLALALPPFAAALLSAHAPQPLLHLQYAQPLVVPLLIAAGRASAALNGRGRVAWLAVPAAVAALTLGSLPPALSADPAPFTRPPGVGRLLECTSAIPAQAGVAADDPLLAPLASREEVRELTWAEPSDFLVTDRLALLPGYVLRADRERAASEGERPVLCVDGRFEVLGPLPANRKLRRGNICSKDRTIIYALAYASFATRDRQ
jgi:uncharacterized membrane protein